MRRWRSLEAGDGHAIATGIGVALVGFTCSFAIVLAGVRAVGATVPEAGSSLFALLIVTGLVGMWCSFRLKIPVSIAWSTPGAALLVTAGRNHYGFPVAVGAFAISGALMLMAGLVRPLGRLVASIPPAVGSAMLAGILVPLCTAPIEAVVRLPRVAIPIVVTWLVLDRIMPRIAIPGAVIALVIAISLTEPLGSALSSSALPDLHWTNPSFNLAAVVGIAIPLFVVTMAAQNVPGMAVLKAFGYDTDLRPLLVITGGATILVAPFGGVSVNLAAITAALCAAPEAHPNPIRRWLVATVAGATYVVLGLAAGAAAVLAALAPVLVLETVAGLALLRALGGALGAVGSAQQGREAAVVAFVITVSQISVAGIGAPFWGLVTGTILTLVETHGQRGDASRTASADRPALSETGTVAPTPLSE